MYVIHLDTWKEETWDADTLLCPWWPWGLSEGGTKVLHWKWGCC